MEEVPGIAAGTLRDKPYPDDLLQPEAPLATLFLEWVGENFPGWSTKTNKLVRCQYAFQTKVLNAKHSFLRQFSA